uniref:Uncharacterized protein n=1 Tax=Setaria viridis TaxID=4556 RepID=A0A4U6VTK9_SETVI|nr:hypothetical protein SEVIR_2G090032v2 [Setaria viridis]
MLRAATAGGHQRGGLRHAVVRSAGMRPCELRRAAAMCCGGSPELPRRWCGCYQSVMLASIASGECLYRC